MQSQFVFPTRQIQRGSAIEASAVESNPAWQALAVCLPRQINGTTYSQMVARVAEGEVLVARVAVYIQGRFHPHQKEIACWIANSDSYNALIHGPGASNREIIGYYAVATDRLLSLLFA